MNTVCVEKPSEAILTLLGPREITQERNEMNVKNVGECLVIFHPFGPMCELMLARNPVNVFSVGNLLVLTHPLWHMCEATLERNYEFHQCGKVFRSSLSLAVLKRIHNWEKLYKCNDCGKTSSGAGTWLCIREWTPGRDCLCDDCGRTFSRKFHLMAHMRTHNGKKLSHCSNHGKAFNRSSNLTARKRVRTGEIYRCSYCRKLQ